MEKKDKKKQIVNIDKVKHNINSSFYGNVGGDDEYSRFGEIIKNSETSKPLPQEIEEKILSDEIENIVDKDYKLKGIILPVKVYKNNVPFEKLKQIKKEDINYIFSSMVKKLYPKYSIIDIYASSAEYFGVDSTTFYKKLNTKYKELLINQFNSITDFLKKKGVTSLF